MQQKVALNSNPSFLRSLIREQFPELLGARTEHSGRAILSLLADQLEVAEEANAKTDDALRRSAIRLGVSIAAGIALSALTLAATSPKHHPAPVSAPNHPKLLGASEEVPVDGHDRRYPPY